MSSPPEIEALIRGIPKAELHVHLEGSISPELALRLAARHGIVLPGSTAGSTAGSTGGSEALRERYRYSDFRAFVELYLAVSACLNDAEDFELAAFEVARGLAEQNVVYAEMTFTPMTHVARGVDADAMLAGLASGSARAREEFGVELAWVFDIVRTLPDQAEPTLDLALRHRRQGVVGLGLGGPEGWAHDMSVLAPTFSRARSEGLYSLPHAGEMAGPKSIWSAIDELGARRIGHGVRCLEDPSLVQILRERQIPLEVCPSSNVALGVAASVEQHPLPQLIDAGIPVSLGSDDPPLFGTTLVDEYLRCATAFEWGREDVVSMAAAAVEHACVDEDRRAELREAQNKAAGGLA